MRRILLSRGPCVAFGLMVTLAWSWSQLPATGANLPKPCNCGGDPIQQQMMVTACQADITGGGIDNITTNATTMTCLWYLDYSCPAAQVNQCAACYAEEVDYYTGTNPSPWIVAPGGLRTPTQSYAANCSTSTELGLQTTYRYGNPPVAPLQPGQLMRIIVSAAGWNPTLSANCNGQDYQELAVKNFTIPSE